MCRHSPAGLGWCTVIVLLVAPVPNTAFLRPSQDAENKFISRVSTGDTEIVVEKVTPSDHGSVRVDKDNTDEVVSRVLSSDTEVTVRKSATARRQSDSTSAKPRAEGQSSATLHSDRVEQQTFQPQVEAAEEKKSPSRREEEAPAREDKLLAPAPAIELLPPSPVPSWANSPAGPSPGMAQSPAPAPAAGVRSRTATGPAPIFPPPVITNTTAAAAAAPIQIAPAPAEPLYVLPGPAPVPAPAPTVTTTTTAAPDPTVEMRLRKRGAPSCRQFPKRQCPAEGKAVPPSCMAGASTLGRSSTVANWFYYHLPPVKFALDLSIGCPGPDLPPEVTLVTTFEISQACNYNDGLLPKLPASLTQETNGAVLALGVLEQVCDIPSFLEALKSYYRPLIVSYSPVDSKGTAARNRINSLTTSEWRTVLKNLRLSNPRHEARVNLNGLAHLVYWFEPGPDWIAL